MVRKKGIAILGSTGSIGTQALEVIESYPEYFDLQVITANSNADLLIEQAKKFQPNAVVIVDDASYQKVKTALWDEPIKVFAGAESLQQIVTSSEIDVVLTALVGYAGLKPTIEAIKAKKTIALANKETLVVAGELINQLALENNVMIYPVDSEHSAIFQCLTGESGNPIEKIYLTASGGPFRGWKKEQLEKDPNFQKWRVYKQILDIIYANKDITLHIYGPEFLSKLYPDSYKGFISYKDCYKVFSNSKINTGKFFFKVSMLPRSIGSSYPCVSIFIKSAVKLKSSKRLISIFSSMSSF